MVFWSGKQNLSMKYAHCCLSASIYVTSVVRVRKYIKACILFLYLCVILNHEFMLITPVLIQDHWFHSSFPPSLICSFFSDKGEPGSHYPKCIHFFVQQIYACCNRVNRRRQCVCTAVFVFNMVSSCLKIYTALQMYLWCQYSICMYVSEYICFSQYLPWLVCFLFPKWKLKVSQWKLVLPIVTTTASKGIMWISQRCCSGSYCNLDKSPDLLLILQLISCQSITQATTIAFLLPFS